MTSTAAGTGSATMRFGLLDITYDDRVLRPRPWTAAQSAWAAEVLRDAPPGPVLELCSGAGQIGLLAILDNDRTLVAVDADPVACAFARINARAAGLDGRVEIRNAMLADALGPDELFPVVIADPPWVPTARTGDYPGDPVFAIDGGHDGLTIADRCLDVARGHLVTGGLMLLQLGTVDQAEELAGRLEADASSLVVDEVRQPDPSGVVVRVRRTG